MKKIIVLIVLTLSFSTFAQKQLLEGKITSKQTMSSDNDQVNGQLALMGDMQSTTYFKNNKSRSEMSNPMTGDVVTIIDTDAKQMLMLMDNPYAGKKYMLTPLDPTKEELEKIKVEKSDLKKTILGYDCNQIYVNADENGQNMKMEFFVTDAISAVNENSLMFKDEYKGFPLYMKMEMNQMGSNMTIISEVTEINEESVPDTKFDLTPPEGYDKMGE